MRGLRFARRRLEIPQIMRFGTVGVFSAVLYLAILAVLDELTTLTLSISAGVAYFLGMVANYNLQRTWTYRSNRSHMIAAPLFVSVHAVGLLLNAGILEIFVTQLGLPFPYIQFLAIGTVAAWSYGAQKVWVFIKRNPRG